MKITTPDGTTESFSLHGLDRSKPEGIAAAVAKGGRIRLETAIEMMRLIEEKTDYVAWLAIEVQTPMMLKTVDNEDDAQETLQRLRAAPEKGR